MGRHLVLTVRLMDRRYHGAGEWPPAPARVFQALVAGAAQGRRVGDEAARALQLLEGLPPPLIAAPVVRDGQRVSLFVPNNDLDAVDGDPDRVGEVRAKKIVRPRFLESDDPFVYAWPLPERGGEEPKSLADGLYQLGRGVDPAWAVGEVLDDEQLAARLRLHRGTIHRPVSGGGSNELAVPTTSSFASIVRRFDAALIRLRPSADGRTTHFVQPPKAHFAMVHYDGTPMFHLFELRSEREPARFSPWATWRATSLIEHVRDMAVAILSRALPERKAEVVRVLVGRKADGTNGGTIEERVRLIPLPSIGHEHADQSIRRILVQIPPGPLSEGDILWALSGRAFFDPQTGEVGDTMLAAAASDQMVGRYRQASRIWRSVTPVALKSAPRRRMEPKQLREQAKAAFERQEEERAAGHAAVQSLRHAGIMAALVGVRVQREPFEALGMRAERFAAETRFPKEALWHVEVEFDRAIRGPLVLGDGRFLGLGVMAPRIDPGAFVLDVDGGLNADIDTMLVARALRRAVMSRAQAVLGVRSELPPYFHGHTLDGEPLRTKRSSHLAFSVDLRRSRLLIVPPHVLEPRYEPRREVRAHLDTLERALEGFTELRAGSAGLLRLRVSSLSSADPLSCASRVFRSVTDYVVTNHARSASAEQAVILDVLGECERRGLPKPDDVSVTHVRGVSRVGVVAHVALTFAVSMRGPILLGKTRYLGGGLFEPVESSANASVHVPGHLRAGS